MAACVVMVGLLPGAAVGASSSPSESTDVTLIHRRVSAGDWLVHRTPGIEVSYRDAPAGSFVLGRGGSALLWWPSIDDVGRHRFEQESRVEGRRVRTVVIVDVLAAARPSLLLAMGDSIASGHGLDSRDYLGFDDCWRHASGSYSGRVARELGTDGPLEPRLVACSGARVADLWSEAVTGGPDDIDGRHTQLEWALLSNPGIITLTIGANDLRFDRPLEFFSDGEFVPAVATRRLGALEADLEVLLERLVGGTSATIVLTTVHNPVADTPHGVPGCRDECFKSVVTDVSGQLNAVLGRVAGQHHGRVLLADASPAFEGHGAPNGRGPDWLRAGGGWLSRHLPIPTRGVHPFCARGHRGGDTWINAGDCVHPNGEGHDAYARAVLDALGV